MSVVKVVELIAARGSKKIRGPSAVQDPSNVVGSFVGSGSFVGRDVCLNGRIGRRGVVVRQYAELGVAGASDEQRSQCAE